MRKIKLLLVTMLSFFAWTGVMAQTDAEYEAALAAITDGADYYVKCNVNNTYYYLRGDGTLTANKIDAGIFKFQKSAGENYGYGFMLNYLGSYFSNPASSGNINDAKLNTSSRGNASWEAQVFFLKDGKYAVRTTNTKPASSGWNHVASAFWRAYETKNVNVAGYQYDPTYIWELEKAAASVVKVTYTLYESDGTTKVGTAAVRQEANSAINIPLSLTSVFHGNMFHKFLFYEYATSGSIGNSDCEISVNRSIKTSTVRALSSLSNEKAYNIACKRGALLSAQGYMISTDLNAKAHAAGPGKFAIINYENKYYLYSADEGKLVKNNGALISNLFTEEFSAEDAINIEAKTDPYFLYTFTINGSKNGLNTNGNDPLGYVINSWTNADDGNQYYMIEAADFDPTKILADLEDFYHPTHFVKYVIKEGGKTLYTSDLRPTYVGAQYTALPNDVKRDFYTYSEINVTIEDVETTTIEAEATWNGPFEISENLGTAHWYDMAMRMEAGKQAYYVTSGVKDGDGAYKTQLANTMGLVEDAYQWAFIGNGYDGFKIINKAAGDGKSFGWTDETATNAGIPTIMADGEGHHAWKIVPSKNANVPAGSFCLNVPGTDLYINQYGGAGGSVKFWNSTGNLSDAGSAFTVFDVPTNFAEYVTSEIAPSIEATGYFAFTDAAKAEIGYKPAYKEECTFETYKSMKEKLATALNDINNFVLPETGYYILKNKNYDTYFGISPSDGELWGNYANANVAKNIVKLTKNNDNTYTISLMGKFAPATVKQSAPVTATTEAANYTVVITKPGYAAFQADTKSQYSCLHRRADGDIVGWEAPADASMWEAIDAEGIEIELAIKDAGYATTYLPFDVAIPEGVTAYTATMGGNGKYLDLTEVKYTIPEQTAVILKGDAGKYTFKIGEGVPEDALKIYEEEVNGSAALAKEFAVPTEGNILKGTLEPINAVGKYVLAKPEGMDVCFYQAISGNIEPCKAYLELPAETEVKAFYFRFPDDDATAIESLTPANAEGNAAIYNIAGQRINKLQKGINIVNGKKILR